MGLFDRLFGKKPKPPHHGFKFSFIIYDDDDPIERNVWYQKALWNNKNFVSYKGTWSSDWRRTSHVLGGPAKVTGISRGNRTLDFLRLAQTDGFKMYLEDDPTNPVNKNARKVMISATVDGELVSKHIGYLPDEIANQYAGVELNISPRQAFLPTSEDLNVGVGVTLLRRSARYLKKKAKE